MLKKVMRLLSVQLLAVLGDMLMLGKSRKRKPKLLYAGLLFFIVVMSIVSFTYNLMIGSVLGMYHSLEVLPAMMMVILCITILMTTVFKVKGTVFGFRDYDLVMSLPVSMGEIIASRLIILYSFNFIFVLIVMVPMMIAYGILAHPGILFYVFCSVGMLFLPLVPIVVASLVGTLIAFAASKFRHQNLLNIIFSLGLLVIVFGFSFLLDGREAQIVDVGKAIVSQVDSMYPLAGLFTDAVISYDVLALVMFIGISVLAFFLYTALLKLVFKKMNTAMLTGTARADFKMGELKSSSPWKALYRKELKRFFASSLYVLNTGIGIVLLTVGAIAMIFVDLGTLAGDPQAAAQLVTSLPVAVSFCVVLTCPSAASISLEGRSLWIVKSLPVTYKQVYLSKLAVNFTIAAPAILDAAIIGWALGLGIYQTVLLVLVTAASIIFIACYGLLINLVFPNFNWVSEVTVVKQSAAVMVTIFTAMAYVGIQFVFLVLLGSFLPAYLAFLILTLFLDVALYLALVTYGKKRYAEL